MRQLAINVDKDLRENLSRLHASPVAGAVLIAFNNSSSKRFDAAVSRRSIEWIKCCQHAVLDRSMFERGEISTEEYIPTKYHALPEECGRARTIAKDAEKESVHHTLMPCRNSNLKENCQRMIKKLCRNTITFSCNTLITSDSDPPSETRPSSSILQSHCHT